MKKWTSFDDCVEQPTPTPWTGRFFRAIRRRVNKMGEDGFNIVDATDEQEQDDDEQDDDEQNDVKQNYDEQGDDEQDEQLPSTSTAWKPYTREPKRKKMKFTLAPTRTCRKTTFMNRKPQNDVLCYDVLVCIFKYLSFEDLLRAKSVCVSWREAASCSSLWQTVRLKQAQIHDRKSFPRMLAKYGTVHLDISKMEVPWYYTLTAWQQLAHNLQIVETLKKLDMCQCDSIFIEHLITFSPQLEVINANAIEDNSVNLKRIAGLKNLKELSLHSLSGFVTITNVNALANLEKLKYLSLTSVRRLENLNMNKIAKIKNLEVLKLGNCSTKSYFHGVNKFIDKIPRSLPKLTKLILVNGEETIVLERKKN